MAKKVIKTVIVYTGKSKYSKGKRYYKKKGWKR